MNVLWFSWKDTTHPQAGGAETVSTEIMRHLVKDGHTVKLITSSFPNAKPVETIGGIEIHRVGGRFSVYIHAWNYYRKHLKGWEDAVLDEMNTLPFLAGAYAKSPKKILLFYQLARSVWFYQMIAPFSIIGYLLEPLLLRYTARFYPTVITESKSSKKDIEHHGFKNVQIFRVGMSMKPLDRITPKKDRSLVLSLGSVRPMKRTLHAVKAFEYARDHDTNLHMVIAGDINSPYGRRVMRYISHSRHHTAIDVRGRVASSERLTLMRQAGVILVTSLKEGWGLIVTEANSQGTPAIVYDVDGLRDSVTDGVTGIVSPNAQPAAMGAAIISLTHGSDYETLRKAGLELSRQYTFDTSYADFLKTTKLLESSQKRPV